MTISVQKYILSAPTDGLNYSSMAMPMGADVLAATKDGSEVSISAMVDVTNPTVARQFLMVGEGEPFEEGWGGFLGVVKIGATRFYVFNTW